MVSVMDVEMTTGIMSYRHCENIAKKRAFLIVNLENGYVILLRILQEFKIN